MATESSSTGVAMIPYASLGTQIGPSPYPHGVKCYVMWRATIKRWVILGHRWGEVPYTVGEAGRWEYAIERAQAHVRAGGLAWTRSPMGN